MEKLGSSNLSPMWVNIGGQATCSVNYSLEKSRSMTSQTLGASFVEKYVGD